jgi:hypothetical protein
LERFPFGVLHYESMNSSTQEDKWREQRFPLTDSQLAKQIEIPGGLGHFFGVGNGIPFAAQLGFRVSL